MLHRIVAGDGTQLSVLEKGDKNGPPILFIHGALNCRLAFRRQLESEALSGFRLVAMDLRGHGDSDKPLTPASYRGPLFADDVKAVIDTLGLDKPLLVGWSLGGKVVLAYMQHHGQEDISGVVMTASTAFDDISMRPPEAAQHHAGSGRIGEKMTPSPEALRIITGTFAPDLSVSIPAVRQFVRFCASGCLTTDEIEEAIAWGMVVPSAIRLVVGNWPWKPQEVLEAWAVPLLIAHGAKDPIIPCNFAERLKEAVPEAILSIYERVGHSPFVEDPHRYNAELAAFAAKAAEAPKRTSSSP